MIHYHPRLHAVSSENTRLSIRCFVMLHAPVLKREHEFLLLTRLKAFARLSSFNTYPLNKSSRSGADDLTMLVTMQLLHSYLL